MWKLPLNSVRAFAAIYDSGGIRAAGRLLGIGHSSVSRHLTELEAWLGVRLTLGGAGRRALTFTPQGRALGEAALTSQRELANAVASLQEARSSTSVQIGAGPSVAARWLLPRLPALEAAHPGIEVSLIVDRKLGGLDGSDLDLAISMGAPRAADRHRVPLMGDQLYPVMSPAHWERSGKPSTPRDLARFRLLHDRDPQASWAEWKRVHGPTNLDIRKGPRFTSTDLVLRAAANGQGVALARHRLAAGDVASGLLIRPLGDLGVVLAQSYWLVLPSDSLPTEAASAVIAWLKSEAD